MLSDVPSYDERLWVPVSWWLLAGVCIALLGAEIHVGLGWGVAVGVYAVLAAFVGAMFWSWGRARIQVAGGELRAGTARLPLSSAGQVVALDAARARALRGPRADPTAFMLLRPYLSRAVYIEVVAADDPAPYWLIFTRHPDRLAYAINAHRAPSGAS